MVQISILLRPEQDVYKRGESVKGEVQVKTKKRTIDVNGIILEFRVYEYVLDKKAKDPETNKPVELINVLHHKKAVLFGNGEDNWNATTMRGGAYSWPFAIQLPEKYPPSFTNAKGTAKIVYEFKARVDCVDKPRQPAVREVIFQSGVSLIPTPLDSLTPPEKSEQKGFLFARNSPLTLFAKLLCAWATLGSETTVVLRVENQSNKTVTGVKVSLIQVWTINNVTTRNTLKEYQVQQLVLPSGTFKERVQISLPEDAQPTLTIAKNFSLEYLLLVECVLGGSTACPVELPVVLITPSHARTLSPAALSSSAPPALPSSATSAATHDYNVQRSQSTTQLNAPPTYTAHSSHAHTAPPGMTHTHVAVQPQPTTPTLVVPHGAHAYQASPNSPMTPRAPSPSPLSTQIANMTLQRGASASQITEPRRGSNVDMQMPPVPAFPAASPNRLAPPAREYPALPPRDQPPMRSPSPQPPAYLESPASTPRVYPPLPPRADASQGSLAPPQPLPRDALGRTGPGHPPIIQSSPSSFALGAPVVQQDPLGPPGQYATMKPLAPPVRERRASIRADSAWEINFTDLRLEREIGSGAYGVIYKSYWRGQFVAVKQLLPDTINDKQLDDFRQEAAVMQQLRPHRNVVQLLGVCTSPSYPFCIVTEFVESGSLRDLLDNTQIPITDMDLRVVVRGIAAGMLHLASENIVHRDLAARNVLLRRLEGYWEPKISDFGLSRFTENRKSGSTKSNVGPLKWMAPEALKDKVYSAKSDAWSFGVTLWECLNREAAEPFPDLDPFTAAVKVMGEGLHVTLPDPQRYPLYHEIMTGCFDRRPAQRPDFEEIVAMLDSEQAMFS